MQTATGGDIRTITPPPNGEVGRFIVEVHGREVARPGGTATQVSQRFIAEVAPGTKVREMSERFRSSEQQCSAVRKELQNVLGDAQSGEQWWMGNFANFEKEVRNDATVCQITIGAGEARPLRGKAHSPIWEAEVSLQPARTTTTGRTSATTIRHPTCLAFKRPQISMWGIGRPA